MTVPIGARLDLDNQASHFKPLVTTLTTLDLCQSNNMIGTINVRGGLTSSTWRFADQLWLR